MFRLTSAERFLSAGIIFRTFIIVMPLINDVKSPFEVSKFNLDSMLSEALVQRDANHTVSLLPRENSLIGVDVFNSTGDPNPNKTPPPIAISLYDLDILNSTGDVNSTKILRRFRRQQNMHLDQAITEGFVYVLNPFTVGILGDAIVTEISNEYSIYLGDKLYSGFFTDTYRFFIRVAVNVGRVFRGTVVPGQIGTFYTTRRKYKYFPPDIIQSLTSGFINWTYEKERFRDYREVSMTNFSLFDFQPRRIFNGWWSQEKLELRWVKFNG